MPSLTQYLRESRSARPIADLDKAPQPQPKPVPVGDTERRPERRRVRGDSYRFPAPQEDPRLTQEQGWAMLLDHFRGDRLDLIFAFAQVAADDNYEKVLFPLQMKWRAHRKAVEKFCSSMAWEHQVAIIPNRYFRECFYCQDAWTHFKNVRSEVRKRVTTKGKALRNRANKVAYQQRKRNESPEGKSERLRRLREKRTTEKQELLQHRLDVARQILNIESILAQPDRPNAHRYQSREDWVQELNELKSELGKTLKRTLAQVRGS